jgi:Domain of unknown function (DUF4272)
VAPRARNLGDVSPREVAFFQNPSPTNDERIRFRWHQEAEWTLLWMIGKIEALGLPTRGCDTRRLVDEIVPPLGSDIEEFLASATLWPPGMLLGEDDRTVSMKCSFSFQSVDLSRLDTPADACRKWGKTNSDSAPQLWGRPP